MRSEKHVEIEQKERWERCLAEINEMNFAQRCQCRVDHDTVLNLKKAGFGLHRVPRVRADTIPSISDIVKYPQYWIQFFLENKPKSFWNDFLIPQEYDAWINYFLKTPKNHPKVIAKPGKDGWQRFVYGGHRNPILDIKYQPKSPNQGKQALIPQNRP